MVSFSVAGPTDAAVDVLDAGGKVVRHLGAAALGGKNDPPPPFKPGLTQSIEWDLRDDAGKPATGGPFRARVRLGLSATFDRFIGWEGTPPFYLNVEGREFSLQPSNTYLVTGHGAALPSWIQAEEAEGRLTVLAERGGRYLVYSHDTTAVDEEDEDEEGDGEAEAE